MIVDQALYTCGQRESIGDLSDALAICRAKSDCFLWIGLWEPTEAEFAHVASELALHPLAVEDAVKAHQRPKLEYYGETLFMVLKTIGYVEEGSQVETGEVMAFVGDGFIVTVRHGEPSKLGGLRHHLEADQDALARGPMAVLHAICDKVVDDYTAVAEHLETDVTEIEVRVFSPARTTEAEVIYRLKREVLEFRRAVMPLIVPLERMSAGAAGRVPDELRPFFRDVTDHAMRVADSVEEVDSLLTSALSAHLTQVNVRQNDDMRKISAWVAMAAVPTMIAGIYGMNFDHMPELHWILSYPLVLALMAAIVFSLYRAFRRSGWL
jgi:magnesium transporter